MLIESLLRYNSVIFNYYFLFDRVRVENRDIPVKFPEEADEGIWGGEGVIQGFIREKKWRRRQVYNFSVCLFLYSSPNLY